MSKKQVSLRDAFTAISDLRTHRFSFKGPSNIDEATLPPGLSRVTCFDFIGIAFVDVENKNILSMFSLEPGKRHVVRRPENVAVIVECAADTVWFVEYSNRFNKSDPNRVEAALLRPRTPKEEMQDYLNEVAARALGREISEGLRKGTHEFDMENDDYSEYLEDDEHAPLSVHQMKLIINELEKDLAAEIAAKKQMDIEQEAPPVPLRNSPGAATKSPTRAKGKGGQGDSPSARASDSNLETGDVDETGSQ